MISDSETAATTAPAMPCAARAMISMTCDVARPASSDVAVNSRDTDQEQPAMSVQIAQPPLSNRQPPNVST